MSNKAHTATLNRICLRYGVQPTPEGPYDIQTEDVIIEVETSASVDEAVGRLRSLTCAAYIAVTNKEGIDFAINQTTDTCIGILDPQGNVVKPSGDHELVAESS